MLVQKYGFSYILIINLIHIENNSKRQPRRDSYLITISRFRPPIKSVPDWARRCITSLIGRAAVFSTWYGR